MRKESFQGILLGIVIMCAVFAFITIAWAAFSDTLYINGTATVSAQKWQVEFTDTKDTAWSASAALTPTLVGSAAAPASNAFALTSALVAGNAAGGSATEKELGTLNQSGDKIIYHWYVQNFGTFAADIGFGGVTASGTTPGGGNISLTCSYQDSGTQYDTTLCNNNIIAKVYVGSVSGYSVSDESTYGTLVHTSDKITIPAATASTDDSDVRIVTLVVEFNESSPGVSVVSNNELTVTMGNVTLAATQATTTTAAGGGGGA